MAWQAASGLRAAFRLPLLRRKDLSCSEHRILLSMGILRKSNHNVLRGGGLHLQRATDRFQSQMASALLYAISTSEFTCISFCYIESCLNAMERKHIYTGAG
ncbi:hypothetical protein Y1Q_0004936 [Alligator mississippiensis]|uniref:Uncharacterized protein n=1 Tax=Alligator mississippiensis TaxID=8496 RepID=A0A151MYI5_ALLMI|nr:hypothetical protein Y1Q_0004936 [Alligator mississippiensis]